MNPAASCGGVGGERGNQMRRTAGGGRQNPGGGLIGRMVPSGAAWGAAEGQALPVNESRIL